jgi:hypothetical protein
MLMIVFGALLLLSTRNARLSFSSPETSQAGVRYVLSAVHSEGR